MPKVDFYTITGQKKEKFDLPKEIFAAQIRPVLMAQAVRVYLANQRRAKAKTKARGEIRGSRRKIWRQKGTGRARHGDRYAPIFVGGGVAHGPTGRENYHLKLSKKMTRRAFFSALTTKFKEGKILIIEGLKKIEPKTKKMAKMIEKIAGGEKKVLIVLPEKIENVWRGAKNIPRVELTQAALLNTYEVLNGGKLVFMPESIEVLKEKFLGAKARERQKRKKS